MRTALLILPFLFYFTLRAQTPFAPIGSQWTYTQGSCCGPDSTIAVLQVLSDTVINGRTCSNVTTASGWFGCYEVVHYFTVSNDSMYYFNEDLQQYQLLFRWNAVPGDTWSTPISQGAFRDTLDWAVSDTGHVIIGGVSLRTLTVDQNSRQWELFCPLGGVITEQLGGSAPFTWIYAACDGETYNGLRCYEENIFPMPEPPPPPPISWLNPQYPQCGLVTAVQELSGKGGFTVSPSVVLAGQPFSITLTPGTVDPFMRSWDSTGRLVLEHAVTPSGAFTLSHAGVYFIQLEGNGTRIMTRRLVVY
ncbi:MAG: T9SS type A sorting domain-containing protein [Flavobacteriales bacterium]